MVKLHGKDIYLAALERAHCHTIFATTTYDFDNPTDTIMFGCAVESADGWYEEIQKHLREDVNIRLGIFLNDGTVIGNIALQGIDRRHRSAELGIDIADASHRGKGYGPQAIDLLLQYGFWNLGLERICADVLDTNPPSQKALTKAGFILEGRARHAEYFRGKYIDMLKYSILKHEYRQKEQSPCMI